MRRPLVYVPLALALGAAWAAIAIGAAAWVGRGSVVLTAVATLACALASRPLHARLEEIVDRRFDRPRYEAVRRIERFVGEVREGRAAPEAVEEELAAALGDDRLQLRYRRASEPGYVDRAGRPAAAAPPTGRVATPIERRGQELGVLVHDPLLCERRALLQAALSAAGLAIEVARLRADLAVQVDAVRASRARIAAAEDDERRRVSAELEDGAGRRLDALERALARAASQLPDGDRALGDATRQLHQTRTELELLTSGAAPATLACGLAEALRDLAGRMPATVEVELDLEPLPAEIERTAYFVAAEAVTNAVKHADAAHIVIRALALDPGLVLRIVDDGRGGAGFVAHGGLAGLRERVEAIGGALELRSGSAGTAIEVVFRCG